ncbi:MAG: transcription termination factor Rho [Phycisphaerae bacterium]
MGRVTLAMRVAHDTVKLDKLAMKEENQVEGIFEASGKGAVGGALRNPEYHYAARVDDVLVPRQLCLSAGLRGGEVIMGALPEKSNKRRSKPRELSAIESINGSCVADYLETKPFEEGVAIDPQRQVRFETDGGPVTMRVVDLLTPIGFGQRGLIVAPPRTGKTILLQQMAQAVTTNFPDVHVIVLLIDERPEEVTDMRRRVDAEVVASSNDKDIDTHVRLARLVIEKAKRLVESGRDVFVLLDSLTRLGRAFNASIRGGGRIMSGGLDIRALTEPKAIFGAARNLEDGGSLTIVASALIETGSRMDDVIFNEFKGTGNMEIMLSRQMADRRVWPAIDLSPSGTRKEELLLSPEALEVSHMIRRKMIDRDPIRSMEMLLDELQKYKDNAAFIAAAAPSGPTGLRRRRF